MATGISTYRPLITGTTHMVSTGHYLATSAGYRILEQGGNATDAGVAAGIALNVALPQYTSFGGVAPIIVHDSAKQETMQVSGLGRWPREASIDYFNQHTGGELPLGALRTVTPAAADAWLTTLKLYGTMTFEQVVTPALELAEGGFPIPTTLHRALARVGDPLAHDEGDARHWQSTASVFYPNGKALGSGELLVQTDLGRTFRRLIEIEREHSRQGREQAIQAARDFFYLGDIAREMVDFCRDRGGLLSLRDLAEFAVTIEAPAAGSYKGIDVYTCGPWCQGPTSIQALHILEQFDLKSMGHNTPDYLHTVIEALKLAFSDRHHYYGDPDFVDVPLDGLLSKSFAKERAQAIERTAAHPEMPRPGEPLGSSRRRFETLPIGQPRTRRRRPASRYKLCLRCRPVGKRLLRHSQRWPWRGSGGHGTGLRHIAARLPVMAGPGSPVLHRSGQAPQAHSKSRLGHEGRQGLDAIRHSRRRRPMPVHGAAILERHRVRYGRSDSDRSAQGLHLELPQFLPPPRIPSGAGRYRGPDLP